MAIRDRFSIIIKGDRQPDLMATSHTDNGGRERLSTPVTVQGLLNNTFRNNNTNRTHDEELKSWRVTAAATACFQQYPRSDRWLRNQQRNDQHRIYQARPTAYYGFTTADRKRIRHAARRRWTLNSTATLPADGTRTYTCRNVSLAGIGTSTDKHFYNPPNIGAVDDLNRHTREIRVFTSFADPEIVT